MKALRHLTEQPFIAATGAAALVHSTWALATVFSGHQPASNDLPRLAYWLIPALLISFALDVGQIATSAEIRSGERVLSKYITFGVFAAATYYLQWLYIAHHMPALELAPGVRESWGGFAGLMRDAAVWIIPALLPLSTTLYTLSGQAAPSAAAAPTIPPALPLPQEDDTAPILPAIYEELPPAQAAQEELFLVASAAPRKRRARKPAPDA